MCIIVFVIIVLEILYLCSDKYKAYRYLRESKEYFPKGAKYDAIYANDKAKRITIIFKYDVPRKSVSENEIKNIRKIYDNMLYHMKNSDEKRFANYDLTISFEGFGDSIILEYYSDTNILWVFDSYSMKIKYIAEYFSDASKVTTELTYDDISELDSIKKFTKIENLFIFRTITNEKDTILNKYLTGKVTHCYDS